MESTISQIKMLFISIICAVYRYSELFVLVDAHEFSPIIKIFSFNKKVTTLKKIQRVEEMKKILEKVECKL